MPLDIDDPRRHVKLEPEKVRDVANTDFPGHWPGEDHSFDIAKFRENLNVKVNNLSESEVEFDLIGVDASIGNAFRRIMMAEVPTVAIEHVYVFDNTSIIVDEVLAQRLGLIPLKFDPDKLVEKGGDEANDQNTIVFELEVVCEYNPKAKAGETDPEKLYINSNVTSGMLKWSPQGAQLEEWKEEEYPRPVKDDILIAKLRPGQRIHMQLHCEKNIGKEHAKWSPVATASYRLLPHIIIRKPIPPEHVDKFQRCFPHGVIGVRKNAETGEKEAYVADARKDTVSREVLRHKEFEGLVELTRIRDHFIFTVESSGVMPPERILPESVRVLRDKVSVLRQGLNFLTSSDAPDAMEVES